VRSKKLGYTIADPNAFFHLLGWIIAWGSLATDYTDFTDDVIIVVFA
jgi:hypothetical protein